MAFKIFLVSNFQKFVYWGSAGLFSPMQRNTHSDYNNRFERGLIYYGWSNLVCVRWFLMRFSCAFFVIKFRQPINIKSTKLPSPIIITFLMFWLKNFNFLLIPWCVIHICSVHISEYSIKISRFEWFNGKVVRETKINEWTRSSQCLRLLNTHESRDRFVSHICRHYLWSKIRKRHGLSVALQPLGISPREKMNELDAVKDNIVIQSERRVMQPASAGHVHSWNSPHRACAFPHVVLDGVSREWVPRAGDSHLHDMRFLLLGWLIRV